MRPDVDPTVDYVFKRLCGDEDTAPIAVDILNAALDLPAGKPVSGLLLLNPFVAKHDAEGKVSILDVRARDDPGRQYLLEMQRFVHGGFCNRLLFYWAGSHAEQLLQGDRYEMLLPTYAICFVNETLFNDEVYHHRFRVYDEEHKVLLCKDLDIHVFELSKFNVPVEELKTPLERWLYFFKHGASLDPDNLPATLDVPIIRRAMEVLVKISQTELERQRYLESKRAEQFAASLAADARVAREDLRAAQEKARVAKEEGRQEGVEKGKAIGRIQLMQQLLAQPETSAAELDLLPEQDLVRLEEALKSQLSRKTQANGTPPTDPGP
jgi:predicted transposase/invertase (TIGR01784 family)